MRGPRKLDTLILDLLHYSATLGRKPAHWTMLRVPGLETPGLLRRRVPNRAGTTPWAAMASAHGGSHGILQLLADHPPTRVRQAVEACRREQPDQRRSG